MRGPWFFIAATAVAVPCMQGDSLPQVLIPAGIDATNGDDYVGPNGELRTKVGLDPADTMGDCLSSAPTPEDSDTSRVACIVPGHISISDFGK